MGLRLVQQVRERLFCGSSRVSLTDAVCSLVSLGTETVQLLGPVYYCTQS